MKLAPTRFSELLSSALLILISFGFTPKAAIAQFFSVEQTSDEQRVEDTLFGNQSDLNITSVDLGQIPGGIGLFEHGGFLGFGESRGLLLNTGRVEGLAARNCADGVNAVVIVTDPTQRQCNDRVQPTPFSNDLNLESNFVNDQGVDIPDEVVLRVIFEASRPGRLNLSYVFGSEAFPEFVPPAQFADEDAFRIDLLNGNGSQLIATTSVGTASFNSNLIGQTNSLQTALDGLTDPIAVSIPYLTGQNQLFFSIRDLGVDEGFDSTVFIPQISVESNPAQSIPTPPLIFGFAWMGILRWRDRLKRR